MLKKAFLMSLEEHPRVEESEDDGDEMLKRAILMSLEEHPRVEESKEEVLARAFALSLSEN